jgi:hypothetical protein
MKNSKPSVVVNQAGRIVDGIVVAIYLDRVLDGTIMMIVKTGVK